MEKTISEGMIIHRIPIPDYVPYEAHLSGEFHGRHPQAAKIVNEHWPELRRGSGDWWSKLHEIMDYWRKTGQLDTLTVPSTRFGGLKPV